MRITHLAFAVLTLSFVGCIRETDQPIVDDPAVTVAENVVTSIDNPALKIKVDSTFEYLGRHDIRIRDVAAGERLVFADLDDGKANRLFILQFEGFNEGVDEIYRYNLVNSPEVAGYRWRSNAYAFNVADNIGNSPGSESDSTAQFLSELNIEYPDDWMMWRSLTITTDDLRNELILFYVEDLASTGKSLSDFYDTNGESTEYWRGLMPGIERRANSSFMLSEIEQLQWHPIPRYFDRAD